MASWPAIVTVLGLVALSGAGAQPRPQDAPGGQSTQSRSHSVTRSPSHPVTQSHSHTVTQPSKVIARAITACGRPRPSADIRPAMSPLRWLKSGAHPRGGPGGPGPSPWDPKSTRFSVFLPLNYVIFVFATRIQRFLLCGWTKEACSMVKSLRKVYFSHPTGHYL